MTQKEIDAKVAEFMAESIVVDSMNEAYVYNAMNALRDVAENYYRWGMEDAQEQMMKDAVNAEIGSAGFLSPLYIEDYEKVAHYKYNDKVKIIIIKEE